MALNEFNRDLAEVRRLRKQVITNGNALSSVEMPVVGSYVTPLRQHFSGTHAGPSSASDLPPGLTLNRVISDYLHAMGKFILDLIHRKFGSQLLMKHVQWRVAVPSIWSHNPRQHMKSCMVDAGLVVGGSNGMNASAYRVIMVLQTDAASYCSSEWLSLQRGHKVLLADIGYDTTNVVVEEWVGCEGKYNFKLFEDLMHSSSGLCGRIHVEKQFIEFLCEKIGPLREYLLRFPGYTTRLLEEWKRETKWSNKFIDLPTDLVLDWEEHDKRLGLLHRWSYYEIQHSNKDMQNIVNPIFEANLYFIDAQLSQTNGIRVMVVVGRLAGLSDLNTRIRHRFGDRVGEIVFEEANEITMSKAALRIAQDCFPGKTFDLVVKVIDNVLNQTRPMDWAKNNCVRINQGQWNHLANKLAETKDWLLQEQQNLDIILTWAMHRVLLHLLRVVKRADLLVRECCKSKDWGKAALLQAGNEESFVRILHDLKW